MKHQFGAVAYRICFAFGFREYGFRRLDSVIPFTTNRTPAISRLLRNGNFVQTTLHLLRIIIGKQRIEMTNQKLEDDDSGGLDDKFAFFCSKDAFGLDHIDVARSTRKFVFATFYRESRNVFLLNVSAVLDGIDNRRIRRRTTNPQ